MFFVANNSLNNRFIYSLAGIITTILIVFFAMYIVYQAHQTEKALNNQADHILSFSRKSLASAMWQYNHEYISDYIHSLLLYQDIVYARVTIDTNFVREISKDSYSHYNSSELVDMNKYIVKESNIVYQNHIVGTIYFVITRERIGEQVLYASLLAGLLALILLFITSFTMYILFRKSVLIPLLKLENSAKQIASGVMNTVIDITGDDEIGHLAKTFSQMMHNIRAITSSRDELNKEIKARKAAEQIVAQEKERLMVTLKSIGDGVITTDTDGRITLINKVAEQLTEWSSLDAIGKQVEQIFQIIDSKSRQPFENPVNKVLLSKHIIKLGNDRLLITRKGQERLISDSGAPIFNPSNEIIGVVLVFRDVTEKYQLEMQIQQTQKLESLGVLAGGIAHDFNNMLGVIAGNISYLQHHAHEDAEVTEIFSEIESGTKQAQKLTQQLLTFAKGGAPIKTASDITQIIHESATFVSRGTKVKIEFDFVDPVWITEVDEGQFHQVIGNLVINAIQAMPGGGVIQIQCENINIHTDNQIPVTPGKYVKVVIQDQGVGISTKHLQKIFDPYFTTKQKGSGMGLATVYSIIKNHEGHITVNSLMDKGTAFSIYLPASSQKDISTHIEQVSEHQGKGKILIMDDQEPILKMLGRMLNRMGYETVFAIEGDAAIKLYQNAFKSGNPFDIVILDLTIPGGMGGEAVLNRLLKMNPNIKAIVSSGYANDPIMPEYKNYGFCSVLPKPYTKNQLARVLNELEKRSISF